MWNEENDGSFLAGTHTSKDGAHRKIGVGGSLRLEMPLNGRTILSEAASYISTEAAAQARVCASDGTIPHYCTRFLIHFSFKRHQMGP